MSTMIRSAEAARVLGVSTATLYAYVSRGRLGRTTAPDGRTSLFARDEVERLAERSRRSTPGRRPTIDVQIRSDVTTLDDDALAYRGHDVNELVERCRFEDVAELLWSSQDRAGIVPTTTTWPTASRDDIRACSPHPDGSPLGPIAMLAVASQTLGALHRDDQPADAGRRLLLAAPALLGSKRRSGPYALRLTHAWRRRPEPALVDAVDGALGLLADHELATSTLAVRIAASVRATPYEAFTAGLATLQGALHGSASDAVHRFLARSADLGPKTATAQARATGEPIPGFGHKVYRGVDPRFGALMARVRHLDPARCTVVDDVVREVGRTLPVQPNIDLALGALSWVADLDPDVPIFAVARIAGWAAHYREELDERPVRFRGVAGPRRHRP